MGFVEVSPRPAGPARATPRFEARLPALLGARRDVPAAVEGLVLGHVGLGSVGLNAALFAARLGVRGQLLCDPGVFKPESLLTHPIAPEAVERSKAEHAGRLVKDLNPAGRAAFFPGPLQELDLFDLAGVSALVVAPDNLSCARDAGEVAQRLGVPLLQAAVHGSTLGVAVRVLRAACPFCLFTERDHQDLLRERRFTCGPSEEPAPEDEPVDDAPHGRALRPTVAPAALCALAGAELVLALLRLEAGVDDALVDAVYDYSALAHRGRVTRVERRPDCPIDHAPWTLREHARPLAEATPRELLDTAGADGEPLERLALVVEDHVFVATAACACGARFAIRRFLASASAPVPLPGGPLATEVARCPRCATLVPAGRQEVHVDVPGEALGAALDRPLCELGAGAARAVRVQRGEATVRLGPPGALAGAAAPPSTAPLPVAGEVAP